MVAYARKIYVACIVLKERTLSVSCQPPQPLRQVDILTVGHFNPDPNPSALVVKFSATEQALRTKPIADHTLQ
jgi:hypothetical protein